ncbi:MAG TPA: imidazoleglycerol-phosphate dehydratase [Spirochaetia bacterium]|nr:imidazoleglycerol-phosphate dehydratase [Spirochaetia bacterium]
MKERSVSVSRTTGETHIEATLNLSRREPTELKIELPFFGHLLHAMAFHGGFSLRLLGRGDIDVDAHHLVEDIGIVLGGAFAKVPEEFGPVARFGHAVIPMDDALSEATVDACGRPYLVYTASYPQERSGSFEMALIREFLLGFANGARINLHAHCRYGENSHHMAESLFKAIGKALSSAFAPSDSSSPLSTKGVL